MNQLKHLNQLKELLTKFILKHVTSLIKMMSHAYIRRDGEMGNASSMRILLIAGSNPALCTKTHSLLILLKAEIQLSFCFLLRVQIMCILKIKLNPREGGPKNENKK